MRIGKEKEIKFENFLSSKFVQKKVHARFFS